MAQSDQVFHKIIDIVLHHSKLSMLAADRLRELAEADVSGALSEALTSATTYAKECLLPVKYSGKEEDNEWVNETPELPERSDSTAFHGYAMHIWNNSAGIQDIDLTREEYVALKGHLATMRGLKSAEASE